MAFDSALSSPPPATRYEIVGVHPNDRRAHVSPFRVGSHELRMDLRGHILIAIGLATIENDLQDARLWLIADGLNHARFDRNQLCHGCLHLYRFSLHKRGSLATFIHSL